MTDQHEVPQEGSEPTAQEGAEQTQQPSRKPVAITRFGGNVNRMPTSGWRKALLDARINVGASYAEIIAHERERCRECREELRQIRGAPCIGTFSGKGGPGKSTIATLFNQMFYDLNPGYERPILIDVNTSMTTLDVLNGLSKADFIKGKYWTMETLYAHIAEQGDIDELDDLNTKLAYRTNPQLPIIPLLVAPVDFGSFDSDSRSGLTGDQYLEVLKVLKKFFTVIVHDFGTDMGMELTRRALAQQHMLGMLTHSGLATTQMVAPNMETLYKNLYGLLCNTQVIFNLSYPPSREAERAIALEKAGKSLDSGLLRRLTGGSSDNREIQTPGQAMEVINDIIDINEFIDPLVLEEIHLVGFDPHLKRESRLDLDKVSPAVEAQLWTLLHWMLYTRVMYEREILKDLQPGEFIRREMMTIPTPPPEEDSAPEAEDSASEEDHTVQALRAS